MPEISVQSEYAGALFRGLAGHASDLLTSHILLVWLLLLIAVGLCGFLVSKRASSALPVPSQRNGSNRGLRLQSRTGLIDRISAIALLLFVTFYVCLIFYKEDFAYYDDDMLTDFSVQGHNFPAPVWPGQGRFYPLADQEFNLLRFMTRAPAGYHALVAVELLVLLGVLLLVLSEFKIRHRALILIAAMLAPGFLISFTGFVYPERNVLFWLAIMLLCLQGYSKTKKPIYFVGCLVATHFALYYKETVVLLVVGYAVCHLLLELYRESRAGHFSWQEWVKNNALPIAMLAVSGFYVVLFGAVMLPHRHFSYVTEHREALSSVLLAYLQTDWLPLIMLAVLIGRVVWSRLSKNELDPMWDSLALGALAYCAGVIAVRLNSGYYLAPANFIALLYLANMSLRWLVKPTRFRVAVVAILFLSVLLHDAAYSSFRIIERKGVISAKSELADFLKGYLPAAHGSTVELFFPYADGFRLMELSAYLRYKGFHLAGQSGAGAEATPQLVFAGRGEFTNDQCVGYRDYMCIHQESAPPGALIVVLPDDDASMNDIKNIGEDSAPLLSIEAPDAAATKSPWFRSLHAISPEFSVGQLPEHWLQLHIFKTPE